MYGEFHLTARQWLRQARCWHAPVRSKYYDYTCPKCGFVHDDALSGISMRCLGWWLTGRLPE